LLGGEGVGTGSLTRLYAWHALGLPLALLLLVGVHVALARTQGSALLEPRRDAQPRGAGASGHDAPPALPFSAEQVWVDLGVAMGLLLALNLLSTMAPVTMGAMADPLVTPRGLKPLWFLLPAMSAVRLLPRAMALGAMIAVAASVLGWPYLVSRVARSPRARDVAVALATLGLVSLGCLGLWETLRAG
jgi:ubiquinol-cytochrome c reductase cytochrome b subunit